MLEGLLEQKVSCPTVMDEDNEMSPRFSLRLSRWLLLLSGALEDKDTRRSGSLTDPTGSL